MQLRRQALGAVLLTLGLFTLALLLAVMAIGSVGGAAARAAVPVQEAVQAAASSESGGVPGVPARPSGVRPCPVPLAPVGNGAGNATDTGYASICWNASSDDTGVVGYDIYRLDVGGFVHAATTTSTVGGFSGELGRLYTMYVVAKDAAGNVSPPSSLITVAAVLGMSPTSTPTPPPGDRIPPSQPTGLRDGCLMDFEGVAFCWQRSTDNVAVTAYDVYRETATGFMKVGTVEGADYTSFLEHDGLVIGQRYTYIVVARDAAGNVSVPSEPLSALAREGLPSPSPSPTIDPTCVVSYRAATWGSKLNAEVTVRNAGATAIDGWKVTVRYPAWSSVRLVSGWSADWTQGGTEISGVNKRWNEVLHAGSATQIGFTASYSGSVPAPITFLLNGRICATS
ncbi:hypothetical protein DP939_01155 [Spongiactinospora rosea]|uniref:CBM2 domain-containing protein n=1 Tax=Spongiactinospora rosea TaxID=2248750 RepID=A0A366M5N4_9ACTN|nr:cellulose binding domain-containing protein [Spongiactinospora rosea]RBQ21357.1 hypothetical protein DP939_01155 [Spongiactinospora rosea]